LTNKATNNVTIDYVNSKLTKSHVGSASPFELKLTFKSDDLTCKKFQLAIRARAAVSGSYIVVDWIKVKAALTRDIGACSNLPVPEVPVLRDYTSQTGHDCHCTGLHCSWQFVSPCKNAHKLLIAEKVVEDVVFPDSRTARTELTLPIFYFMFQEPCSFTMKSPEITIVRGNVIVLFDVLRSSESVSVSVCIYQNSKQLACSTEIQNNVMKQQVTVVLPSLAYCQQIHAEIRLDGVSGQWVFFNNVNVLAYSAPPALPKETCKALPHCVRTLTNDCPVVIEPKASDCISCDCDCEDTTPSTGCIFYPEDSGWFRWKCTENCDYDMLRIADESEVSTAPTPPISFTILTTDQPDNTMFTKPFVALGDLTVKFKVYHPPSKASIIICIQNKVSNIWRNSAPFPCVTLSHTN
jgi:hypothetical protein